MNAKVATAKLVALLLLLAGPLLSGVNVARAETGYLVTSSTFGTYLSGPFYGFVEGAQDAVAEYQRNRPSYTGLEYCGSPPTAYNTAWLLQMRWFPSGSPPTNCFTTWFYVTPYYCAPGQLPKPIYGGSGCKDLQPVMCPTGGRLSDGISCVVPTSCPADLQAGGYAGMCAAPNAASKNAGNPPQCPDDQCGNPIKPGSGQKYQREAVLRTPTLSLELAYNSIPVSQMPIVPYPFGRSWSFNYGMRVWLIGANKAVTLRPDGKIFEFQPPSSGNVYVPDVDVPDTLTKIVSGSTITGWQYRVAADDSLETYNAEGKLTSITYRNGQTVTLTYSITSTPTSIAPRAGLLITVTDHFGRNLQFLYDTSARIKRATDPVGNQYNFYYDESSSVVVSGQPLGNNLTSIEFPGLEKRIFHYNEQSYTASTNLSNALTGITDENNNRFSTYQYDASARAVSSEHAGGVEQYAITYNIDGTRTITDPLGTARTNSYQTIQRVSKTTAISGSACPACGPAAQTYDSNGFVATKTDWNGNLTTYTRADPNGRLDLETSRTEASGSGVARTITTTWHATFRLPTLITESGRTTAFTYDANGNILTKTVTDTSTSEARVWTYTYSAIGQVLTVDGPRTGSADTTTYTYYANNDASVGKRGNVATITNALSQVTTVNTYDSNGRPLTITDPNGLVTTLTWHARGWLASRALGSETTTYDYDYTGQLTKVTLPDSSYLQYTYDNAHRLTQVADNLGNKVVYTLDNMGNRTQEDVKDPSNTLAQTRTRVYSSLNRLYQDIGGTSPSTQITTYGYDSEGNLTTVTDPLTHLTTNAYDALNRLISITNPLSGVTSFGLNSKDQLTSVTDPRSNATTYTVNALDDVTQQVSPDTGTTARTYDAAGNVLTATDAKSQVTTYVYDALNRITQATYHDNSKVEYGYDAGTYGKGHLTSLTEKNPAGTVVTTTTYTYDLHGRLLTDTRAIGGLNYVTSYGYDSSGRMNSLTYPSGLALAYSFDSAGRISQITATPSGGSPATVLSSVTYHPFGGAKGWTFGNSQTYSRTFDLDGRISGFTLGGTSMAVTFDAASRITGQTYFPVPANSVTYGYDNWDRLTSTVTPSTTYGFGYDANSNRTSKTVGATTWTYAYPGTSNKLASITAGSAVTYTHDANGSITNDGINTFTYDARGRMTGASTGLGSLAYQLNALGQRYAKTLSSTTTAYLYDQAGHLIAETSDGGTTYTEYLWLQDTPAAVIKPGSAALYYIHTDHLDTQRLIANQTPATVWRWDNDDPFGANMANANPSGLGTFAFNLRLPGQYFDSETNYHYNYYRNYSPEIGRYIESDPIGLFGGLNTYSYSDSAPLMLLDLFGLANRVYRQGNSYSWYPPTAGTCEIPIWQGGFIVGWAPCDPCRPAVGNSQSPSYGPNPSNSPGSSSNTSGAPSLSAPGTQARYSTAPVPWRLQEPTWEDYAWCAGKVAAFEAGVEYSASIGERAAEKWHREVIAGATKYGARAYSIIGGAVGLAKCAAWPRRNVIQ